MKKVAELYWDNKAQLEEALGIESPHETYEEGIPRIVNYVLEEIPKINKDLRQPSWMPLSEVINRLIEAYRNMRGPEEPKVDFSKKPEVTKEDVVEALGDIADVPTPDVVDYLMGLYKVSGVSDTPEELYKYMVEDLMSGKIDKGSVIDAMLGNKDIEERLIYVIGD